MTDPKKDPRVADGQLDANRTAKTDDGTRPRDKAHDDPTKHPTCVIRECACPCSVCVNARTVNP